MEKDFNNLLSNLDAVSRDSITPIFIPSLNRPVPFKLISAKQHKEIIGSVMDRAYAGISFAIAMATIVKENIQEKVPILTTDCTYIYTALRALSLSPTYTTESATIDLTDVLKNKVALDDALKTRAIDFDTFKLNVTIPTLDKETQVNRESKKRLTEADNSVQISLGEVYLNEFIKHIVSVEFTTTGTAETVVFDNLTFAQKRQVVEKLPLSAATKLIDYVNELKTESNKFLANGADKITLSIDQAFFTI